MTIRGKMMLGIGVSGMVLGALAPAASAGSGHVNGPPCTVNGQNGFLSSQGVGTTTSNCQTVQAKLYMSDGVHQNTQYDGSAGLVWFASNMSKSDHNWVRPSNGIWYGFAVNCC